MFRDFDDPDRIPGPNERMIRGDARMLDVFDDERLPPTRRLANQLMFLAGLHGADMLTPFRDVTAARGFMLTISPAQLKKLGNPSDELLGEACYWIRERQR